MLIHHLDVPKDVPVTVYHHTLLLQQKKKVLQLQSCKGKYISLNSITSLFRITASGLLLVDSCLSVFFFHCLLHLAQHIFSGGLVRACASDSGSPVDGVWFGAKSDSKGVKGDTPGEPMTSLLRWFMIKLEYRTLEFHPSPPRCVTECTCPSGSV